MFTLPLSITVNNEEYAIRRSGDFRIVLDCFEILNDPEFDHDGKIITALMVFYEKFDGIDDILTLDEDTLVALAKGMFDFFRCGDDGSVAKTQYRVIDWTKDEQMICSAVNKIAGQEIRALPYLHWWTFMGFFSAVGESQLSTVVSIRTKIVKGKKLEKYEQQFRAENPQYFNWDYRTAEQIEEDEYIKKLWSGEV